MPRHLCALALLVLVASAEDGAPAAGHRSSKPILLQTTLRRGQRYVGSNTVSYTLTISEKQGDRETSSTASVERTERFVDKIERAGANGILEIERTYTRLFTKARNGEDGRPEVFQSELQGQTLLLREKGRRRELKLETRGVSVDPIVRRTAGMELDWRDVFPRDPVAPGETWDADDGALASRMAAYLECGTRGHMRVRFEEVVEREGAQVAKLYVDWTLEGMRDRRLFTKVTLAGDLFFDLKLKRVVEVDLVGNIVVRGAIIGQGAPRIVRGEGPVLVKTTVHASDVEAAVDDGEGED